jgi:hypothetical protein
MESIYYVVTFLCHRQCPHCYEDRFRPYYGDDLERVAAYSWIGKILPRGRAWLNELSTATLATNFCNAWSGGLNFLEHRYSGSEVSVDPNGNVYPCCMKTQSAIGNLLRDKLEVILDRLVGNPVYEAISMGHPERMGIAHGWSVETFLGKSTVNLPSGRSYQNPCIGCDAFHREVLMGDKVKLVSISAQPVSHNS